MDLILQTSSLSQLTKAIEALVADCADGFEFFESEAKINVLERMDALEVNMNFYFF